VNQVVTACFHISDIPVLFLVGFGSTGVTSLKPWLKFRILTVKFSSLGVNSGLTKFHSFVLGGIVIVMLDTQRPLAFRFASQKATLTEGTSPISLFRGKQGSGNDGIDWDFLPSVSRSLLTIVSISEATLPFHVQFSRVLHQGTMSLAILCFVVAKCNIWTLD